MLAAIALLFLSAVVDGACPNQCSGRGHCNLFDRCDCYTIPGAKGAYRAQFAGADCSLLTCPYGVASNYVQDKVMSILPTSASAVSSTVVIHPSNALSQNKLNAFVANGVLLGRDFGVDLRVVSVDTSAATITFQYKPSFLTSYSAEVVASLNLYTSSAKAFHLMPDVSGTATPVASGVYVFFNVVSTDLTAASQTVFAGDHYSFNVSVNNGDQYTSAAPSSAHALRECSDNGICDRATGSCVCFPGRVGDACQRTSCPNACSGSGRCQPISNFVQDATSNALTYSAFDAEINYGCICDAGFRGADCSQKECPSGLDALNGDGGAQGRDCSGRGECDYSTGRCICHAAFRGESCSQLTNLQ